MSANSAPTGAIGKSASFLLICWVWILSGLPAAAGQFRDLGAQSSHPGEGKAAFADYNADGLIDLYAGGVLLRNIGNGQFSPVGGSGLPGGSGIWADYDNDGDPDLFVYTRGELYRNEGNGKFVRAGFPELRANTSRAAVWVDINNDALPDLYVAGYEVYQKEIYPDIIFRNTGNGRFVEHWRSSADETRSARGVTAADYNDDGNMDIYVSNYRR